MSIKTIIKSILSETQLDHYRQLKGRITDVFSAAKADHYIKRNAHRTTSGKTIKVGFFVQMPQLWDKQESVYSYMSSDAAFEPWLIIIPAYDFANDRIGEYGDELDYFRSFCKDDKYIIAYKNGKWEDLKSCCFDYVFYQRPYDMYLPEQYGSGRLVSYTKICYIPYATPEAKKTAVYPSAFFRNIYFGFMEDEKTAESLNTKYSKGNHRRFCSLGYPSFEKAIAAPSGCEYSSVLWTPRWTISSSHFLQYYKQLEEMDWTHRKLTVRPHPLMWDHFQKKGRITQDQLAKIRMCWNEMGIEEDSNASIEDTFRSTDILLSDISSIVPMFFLSGKPIILCPPEIDYSILYETLIPGIYVANNWEELKAHLDMLLSGKDPLKEKRREIIETSFAQNRNATHNIIDKIKADAGGLDE